MGFKTGKVNVWTQLREELEETKRQLAAEQQKPMLRAFAEQLGHTMLTQLAATPYVDWPQFAKDTFSWIAHQTPTAAWAYKEALPKRKD